MIVFEEFTDKIKSICNNIINNKEDFNENIYQENEKFIYKNIIRPKIYQ